MYSTRSRLQRKLNRNQAPAIDGASNAKAANVKGVEGRFGRFGIVGGLGSQDRPCGFPLGSSFQTARFALCAHAVLVDLVVRTTRKCVSSSPIGFPRARA